MLKPSTVIDDNLTVLYNTSTKVYQQSHFKFINLKIL